MSEEIPNTRPFKGLSDDELSNRIEQSLKGSGNGEYKSLYDEFLERFFENPANRHRVRREGVS